MITSPSQWLFKKNPIVRNANAPRAREGVGIMNDHIITIERVSSSSASTPSHEHQAKCSCGWVSNRAWLAATVRRVADYHMSAAVTTPIA
jgi:hypothetical protein